MSDYQHLRLGREIIVNERHPRSGFQSKKIEDPKAHGERLQQYFENAKLHEFNQDIGGYDERKILKISLSDGQNIAPQFNQIPGIEILSQEDKLVVLIFSDESGLAEFERRIVALATDGTVVRKELLYLIDNFSRWTPEDRTGAALQAQGFPIDAMFTLDVELWPQERSDRRTQMVSAFEQWLQDNQVEQLDKITQPSLVMFRVRCTQVQAQQMLEHRDVRTVDLPPKFGVSVALLSTDINQITPIDPPPENAPKIAVLDSGVTTGHPLLANAVGDARGYIKPNNSVNDMDPHWHGTFVAGLALYGDVQKCIETNQFIPQLRLLSGKVFEDDGQDQTELVENSVERAVRDLHDEYGCKVFNLSYGDLNKIYDGRHLKGLAYTLDRLTRELGVLFVVPTGNLTETPENAQYPNYLTEPSSRLLDPATALNALTVGGLAMHEATQNSQRYPNTIEDNPLARAGQPFPLTRCGPSINGAIKPDVVEHAGNVSRPRNGNNLRTQGLGVVSLHGGFAANPSSAFKEDIGTSYAAPQVAHKAARLLIDVPEATPNLLRALIGAHAHWPKTCEDMFPSMTTTSKKGQALLPLIGYGRVDDSGLYRSLDNEVTLLAEERILNDKCHFFELPIPDGFWAGSQRTREVTVALAYSPEVRTTRLDYRQTKLWFTLVTASNLDEVATAFQRGRENGIPERNTSRWISGDDRKAGTLQVSRWAFKQNRKASDKVFIVVTRQDANWSLQQDIEPYALTVTVSDRENANIQLYSQIRATLEARTQVRTRVRV